MNDKSKYIIKWTICWCLIVLGFCGLMILAAKYMDRNLFVYIWAALAVVGIVSCVNTRYNQKNR